MNDQTEVTAVELPQTKASVERSRHVRRQFWFLFIAFTLSFLLLAWRNETNSRDISNGLYEACQARVETALQYNEGREALIQYIINNPSRQRTPEERAAAIQQFRDGLLLPIEDCGEAPH